MPGIAAAISAITDDMVNQLDGLSFGPPVTHTYNPLAYARSGYDRYIRRFGDSRRQIILLGMNPGPFGMVQTGVPFGDVPVVAGWMGIRAAVGQPRRSHPKRPVAGFACTRREVSGRRLWGWVRQRFGPPDAFFHRFLVLNYCPLAFMEAGGRNRTPDRLPADEKSALFAICDRALQRAIACYEPEWVVGIGRFAGQRDEAALGGMPPAIGRISHPSPANPMANRGWGALVESELAEMGIRLRD